MGLLNFDNATSKFIPPFKSTRYIWFYIAIAVPVTLLTLWIGWYYSRNLEHERLKSARDEERMKQEQEQQQKVTTSQQLAELLQKRAQRKELIKQWRQENPVANNQPGRVIQALEGVGGEGATGGAAEEAETSSAELEGEVEVLDPMEEAGVERRKKNLNQFLTVLNAIIEDGKDRSRLRPPPSSMP